jgi:hypothetical protein
MFPLKGKVHSSVLPRISDGQKFRRMPKNKIANRQARNLSLALPHPKNRGNREKPFPEDCLKQINSRLSQRLALYQQPSSLKDRQIFTNK